MPYNSESKRLYEALRNNLPKLLGGTLFKMGDISIDVEGKDGLGGLIEEWLGVWAIKNNFLVNSANVSGQSQEFPDYYIGEDKSLLEIKCFDADAGPNFDIANFDAYCRSLSIIPQRLFADYLIFSYRLNGTKLSIDNIWLKKIWEITCPSQKYPLKTQNKKGVIYNIRPATWYSNNSKFKAFSNWSEFVKALYKTEKEYHKLDGSKNEDKFSATIKDQYGLVY
jgi:hypothetical protein